MTETPFDQTQTDSTKDVAAQEAKSVAQDAKQGGMNVAATAKDEAVHVAGEAKAHAQNLFSQARGEVSTQVSTQQNRLAETLRSLSGELNDMSNAQNGMAASLAAQAASPIDQAASWLENREPADLIDEVKRYARRNPYTFLAGAALVGFLGGRVTRGLQADAQRSSRELVPSVDPGPDYATDYGFGRPVSAPTPSYAQTYGDPVPTPGQGTSYPGAGQPLATGYPEGDVNADLGTRHVEGVAPAYEQNTGEIR